MSDRHHLKHPETRARAGELRALTDARVALGRVGSSMPIEEVLKFSHAHARARDAVHAAFDVAEMTTQIEALGLSTQTVRSAARDRNTYLRRPDFGRRLSEDDHDALAGRDNEPVDVVVVIADGLSATAVHQNATPFLSHLLPLLEAANISLHDAVLVHNGRVAIGDEIGALFRARIVIVLIGERPGLSAADSLGVYMTYEPRTGRSDAERNCISNVRDAGLKPDMAARKAAWLIREAIRQKLSGVTLKDDENPDNLDLIQVLPVALLAPEA